jgi:hypothetical protein
LFNDDYRQEKAARRDRTDLRRATTNALLQAILKQLEALAAKLDALLREKKKS